MRKSVEHDVEFDEKLFRYPGVGGWTFVLLPAELAPPATHAWGRTPVIAWVDEREWKTSVWREKKGRTQGDLAAVLRVQTSPSGPSAGM